MGFFVLATDGEGYVVWRVSSFGNRGESAIKVEETRDLPTSGELTGLKSPFNIKTKYEVCVYGDGIFCMGKQGRWNTMVPPGSALLFRDFDCDNGFQTDKQQSCDNPVAVGDGGRFAWVDVEGVWLDEPVKQIFRWTCGIFGNTSFMTSASLYGEFICIID